MDKQHDDLIAELRQGDPAREFRADSHWTSLRLAELLDDDPTFSMPLGDLAERRSSRSSSRTKVVWLASAAAVMLFSGGAIVGNLSANSGSGDYAVPASSESWGAQSTMPEGAGGSLPDYAVDTDNNGMGNLVGEEATVERYLVAETPADKMAWLIGALDPDLSGSFIVEHSEGRVTFQQELAVAALETGATAHPNVGYEASSRLITEIISVFAPNEKYELTFWIDPQNSDFVRATVEFLYAPAEVAPWVWVLEHDGQRPVSFTGVLEN